jgi:hypothetical protein
MSRSSALITLGILILLVPFSGLPSSWITGIEVIFGVSILLMGVSLRVENVKRTQATMTPGTVSPESVPAGVGVEHEGPSAIA